MKALSHLIDIHTHATNGTAEISVVDASGKNFPQNGTPANVFYTQGIHPCDIPADYKTELKRIEAAADKREIIAIGECGFDRTSSYGVDLQADVFGALAEMSKARNLPMIIHCVHAADLLLKFVSLMPRTGCWIVHGFRGKPAAMMQLVDAGCSISFGAKANEESVKACPAERLLIETDTAPADSLAVAYKKYSALRGEDLEPKIRANFSSIFEKK